jgi:uncharacterized protein YbaP (TraB family)
MWRPGVIALLLLGCSSPAARAPVEHTQTDGRKPFMWRVDTPGGPSHLLGTFHVGVDPDEVLPPQVFAELDGARSVVLEVNIAVPEALGLGMQPAGRSLRDDLTAEQWAALVAAMKLDEAAAAQLERVKVWVIVTTVIQELVPDTRSIDSVVQERAEAARKQLVYLEDVAFQAALFDRQMTPELLLALLGDRERQRGLLKRQADAYRSGDEQRMFDESLAPKVFEQGVPNAREQQVYARNRAWIPAIAAEIDRGRMFLAVGVSHLIGPGGVIDLLRQKGHAVTRVTP